MFVSLEVSRELFMPHNFVAWQGSREMEKKALAHDRATPRFDVVTISATLSGNYRHESSALSGPVQNLSTHDSRKNVFEKLLN